MYISCEQPSSFFHILTILSTPLNLQEMWNGSDMVKSIQVGKYLHFGGIILQTIVAYHCVWYPMPGENKCHCSYDACRCCRCNLIARIVIRHHCVMFLFSLNRRVATLFILFFYSLAQADDALCMQLK